MSAPPQTSIALCTYNGEAYLREQLNSFSCQTQLPDELIVCDDGSTDGTMDLLAEYAATAPFVVAIYSNPSNLGSTHNFARAVNLCRGDIVFLSDQDDVWRPDKVHTVTTAFARYPTSGLVFSNAKLVDSSRKPLGKQLWRSVGIELSGSSSVELMDLFPLLCHEYLVTGATLAFRKRYLPVILPFGEGWIHDGWIAFIVSAFSTAVGIDQDLIEYRQHGGQQIGAPPQHEVLGLRPSLSCVRILGMVQQWLLRSSDRRASAPTATLSNDVEQALIRYRSALEHLQRLKALQDRDSVSSASTQQEQATPSRIRLESLSQLSHRVAHLAARCEIRNCRAPSSRLGKAIGELLRGRYHSSGRGSLTFARDVAGF
jgi:hypothetical protein